MISFDASVPVRRGVLERCSHRIRHRGPDADRIWMSHPEADERGRSSEVGGAASDRARAGMAFRRLSILDPDERAMQPMRSRDGRFVLVFNGEIYNFRALRDALLAIDAEPFVTSGDSEVLLRAWQAWGVQALSKLNGMFALAMWDTRESCLWLARDRMGQKPLYVELLEGSDGVRAVSFASEPMGVARLSRGAYGREIDGLALREYLRYGYSSRAMCAGLEQIEPGMWWRVDAGGFRRERYFDPTWGKGSERASESKRIEDDTSGDAVGRVRAAVMRAVERQLVSDVPLGVFLSGGIDSSVVARCAREMGEVRTFSMGFEDARYDETGHAEEVARHLGTRHESLRVTSRVMETLPGMMEVFGEPFADSSMIPTEALCRAARGHVTVALSGDGGDELFGGYERYAAMTHARRLGALALFSGIGRWMSRGHPKSTWTRAGRFLATAGLSAAERYDSWMRVFDERTLQELLTRGEEQNASSGPSELGVESVYRQVHAQSGRSEVEVAMAVDRRTYLPGDLLTKVDRCSMMHGLEVRSPFMDHELVELAAGLDEGQLIGGGGKRMLREAFGGDLPVSVFGRRKMGFAVPIGEWFRGELRGLLRDHVTSSGGIIARRMDRGVVGRLVDEHESGVRDHAHRLYALMILEMWWQQQTNNPRPSVYDETT